MLLEAAAGFSRPGMVVSRARENPARVWTGRSAVQEMRGADPPNRTRWAIYVLLQALPKIAAMERVPAEKVMSILREYSGNEKT